MMLILLLGWLRWSKAIQNWTGSLDRLDALRPPMPDLLSDWQWFVFEQLIDHNRGPAAGYFDQRYVRTYDYYDPKRPIFFVNVNEEDPAMNPRYDIIDTAREAKAAIFFLSLRYTGESLPTHEFSTETLKKLLTVEQMVGDVARFGGYLHTKVDNLKIILFGCSQAGMITAVAHQRHPEIFAGAVSSASPFKFELVDYKYNPVLSSDLANQYLGGSPQCLNLVGEAHTEFASSMVTAEGRRQVETKFGFCEEYMDDVNNQAYTGAALDRLAVIFNTNRPLKPGSCRKSGVKDLTNMLRNKMVLTRDMLAVFQICRNRGLIAECVEHKCPFCTSASWVDFWLMVCEEGFGISKAEVEKNVADLQAYVNKLSGATNILSINGDADPWYPSSITQEREGLQVMWVKGASHCYWCTHENE
ncbi:Thymus-specific serine protease [Perkinsus chesapeaki]|uniref:Thymus-specific serine protease n=1 Tax=Perkinsus chesapeaki TaxID=330153 RepID=A0A7J6LN17_PERCH|nr:Thymus-specific serine protease [Perkinsus chesapeaki]